MDSAGSNLGLGTSLPQETKDDTKIDMKVFGKGGQQSGDRDKMRQDLDTRVGVVATLGGILIEDIGIAMLIKDIVAKHLLSLYCEERKIAHTGSKLEIVQRLLRAGWNLGTDKVLKEDYAKLQPKHGKDIESKKRQAKDKTRNTQGTGARATDGKTETERTRPRTPEPSEQGRGVTAPPAGIGGPPPRPERNWDSPPRDLQTPYPYRRYDDLGYGPEEQAWIYGDSRRRMAPPPPAYPLERDYPRDYAGYPAESRDSVILAQFGTVLSKLAASIDAQTKATQTDTESREEAKEVALPWDPSHQGLESLR